MQVWVYGNSFKNTLVAVVVPNMHTLKVRDIHEEVRRYAFTTLIFTIRLQNCEQTPVYSLQN
jgi:hypothetical protein